MPRRGTNSRSRESTISQTSSAVFAPGFAKKRLLRDNEPEPAFLRHKRHDSSASSDTLDPSSADRSSFIPSTDSNWTQTPWRWNSNGAKSRPVTKIEGQVVAPIVVEQFLEDHEVMDHDDQPQTDFEARNAVNVPKLTRNQTTITSQFGDKTVSRKRRVDDRIAQLDRDENFRNGYNGGRPPKRLIGEMQLRCDKRDQGILKAKSIWREWTSLSEKDKNRRIAECKANQIASTTSRMEEIEEDSGIPAIYMSSPYHLRKKVQTFSLSEPSSRHSRQYSHASASQASTSGLLFLGDDDASTVQGSTNEQEYNIASFEGSSNYGRRTGGRRPAVPAPAGNSESRQSSGRAITTHSRVTTQLTTLYQFKVWPKLIPPVDYPSLIRLIVDDHLFTFGQVNEDSKSKPRVVSIALVDEVKLSGAAFVQRIFGGMIQEIQFFPADRQAVAVFVHPQDASAFITHVTCAAQEDSMEYRGLQIGADWYQGSAVAATLSPQEGLLRRIIAEDASRTIKIGKINKYISKDTLLQTFKDRFDDLHIIRAKLITPRKAYEREPINSNSVSLEFASINEALSAKQRMETNQVKEFEDKPTTFLQDASVFPTARKPWCSCLHCTSRPEDSNYDSNSEVSSGVGQMESRRKSTYKPRRDATRPVEGGYRHDDVKNPRLQ